MKKQEQITEKGLCCKFYGIAARIVLRRCKMVLKNTNNHKRITIRVAMPYNDQRKTVTFLDFSRALARTILMVIPLLSCSLPPKQRAINILQQGIKDKSVIIQVSAAKRLEEIGDIQGIKILYEILEGEDKHGIAAALAALYDLRENTCSPVIAKFTEDSDPLIRAEAFELISLINDERNRTILIKGTDDKIAKIRCISYLGLGKFKEKKIIMKGLRDNESITRIAAAKTLGSIGEKGFEDFIKNELNAKQVESRKQGILALAEMGDTSAIILIKKSLTDTSWELKLAAAEALLILDNREGVEVIKDGLKSDNPFIRVNAVQILKNHRVSEGTELLKEAVKDDYSNVSVAAIEALAKYNAGENRQLFQKMMDASNPLVKIVAAAAYLKTE